MDHFRSVEDQLGTLSAVTMDRRTLLKRASLLGISAVGVSSLLAACGDDETDDSMDDPTEDSSDDIEDSASAEELDDADEDDAEDPEESEEDEPEDDTEEAEAVSGGDVHVMWNQPNVGLSPFYSQNGNEQQVASMMAGTLVKMNAQSEVIPDFAESIEISEDALTFTFPMHEDITFSDGEPLTAEDVVFTYETVIDSRTGSFWGPRLVHIDGYEEARDGETDSVSGLNMPDDYTVEIQLSEPNSAFLMNLCQFTGCGIVPKHILGDVPRDELEQHSYSREPNVTAGPFKFVRMETDQFTELERNESYFRGTPAVERLFLRVALPEVGITLLETGELDIMSLPVTELTRVNEISGIEVEAVPAPSVTFLSLNLEREYLQDKRVRQAMAYALDREGLVETILSGEGRVVDSTIIGPEWMGTPERLNSYDQDPDMARSLLEEAGWDTDQPIEILITATDTSGQDTLAVVEQQWRDVGINASIRTLDSAAISPLLDDMDWDVRIVGGGVFGADPSISADYFHARNGWPVGNNYGRYSNERVDELFELGAATADLDERREIYTELAQILNDELPWIFLYSPYTLHAVNTRVSGYEGPGYTNNKFWNVQDWTVSS
jgi:ABC-type transport system substrate-binding protein